MRHLKRKFRTFIKPMAFLLVCVLSLHALVAHGLTESLVYCFEENGDVNIETTSNYSIGIFKKCDRNFEITDASKTDISPTHPLNGCQNDVEIAIVCSEDTNAQRYSQYKVLQSLLVGSHSVFEYLPVEDTTQRISSQQPHFVDDKTKALQTIVLLI